MVFTFCLNFEPEYFLVYPLFLSLHFIIFSIQLTQQADKFWVGLLIFLQFNFPSSRSRTPSDINSYWSLHYCNFPLCTFFWEYIAHNGKMIYSTWTWERLDKVNLSLNSIEWSFKLVETIDLNKDNLEFMFFKCLIMIVKNRTPAFFAFPSCQSCLRH